MPKGLGTAPKLGIDIYGAHADTSLSCRETPATKSYEYGLKEGTPRMLDEFVGAGEGHFDKIGVAVGLHSALAEEIGTGS